MTTQNRLQVAKLAAILRLADALDDDHQQKKFKKNIGLATGKTGGHQCLQQRKPLV